MNLYTYAGIWLIGVLMGTGAGYLWQQETIDDLKSDLTTMEATGKEAQRQADEKYKDYVKDKEKSDELYKTDIAKLRADNKRLQNKRTDTPYVPAAPATSKRPDFACFDRADLERAIRQFDERTTAIIGKGDEATLELNNAKIWGLTAY